MSANNITHKIKFEIKQINKLLQNYNKLIEDAKNIDENYDLSGDRWHKDLLNQMVKEKNMHTLLI